MNVNASWPPAPSTTVDPTDLPPLTPKGRLKVLHVVTRLAGGAGGNTVLSAVGTNGKRYEVWIAGGTGGAGYEPALWEQAERKGVKTLRLDRFREVISPVDDLVVLVQLIRLIRAERFSVVHTHSSKGGVLGRLAAWLCRTPVIVHTIHGFSTHEFMSAGRRRTYLAIERAVQPMTDAFLAVAPAVADEAVETRLAPPGTVSVVPSAVALDDIPTGNDPQARLEFGIPDDEPLIGTVGRLDHQKAPLDFIRTAALVAEIQPDAHFMMVGDGPLSEEARGEARRLGVDVTFTGFRPDAARIAAGFDVFVISSLYEGLGRALTEALASQRPVAATAVNGVVDIVEHGATGLLSPPADPPALARNVCRLLQHPDEAAALGEAAAARVRALFQPVVMCALIDQSYARLLGPGD